MTSVTTTLSRMTGVTRHRRWPAGTRGEPAAVPRPRQTPGLVVSQDRGHRTRAVAFPSSRDSGSSAGSVMDEHAPCAPGSAQVPVFSSRDPSSRTKPARGLSCPRCSAGPAPTHHIQWWLQGNHLSGKKTKAKTVHGQTNWEHTLKHSKGKACK